MNAIAPFFGLREPCLTTGGGRSLLQPGILEDTPPCCSAGRNADCSCLTRSPADGVPYPAEALGVLVRALASSGHDPAEVPGGLVRACLDLFPASSGRDLAEVPGNLVRAYPGIRPAAGPAS